MALRDTINIQTKEGSIEEAASFDRRVWLEENDLLETDVMREDTIVTTLRWYACDLLACTAALQGVENTPAKETPGESILESARYWIDNRKTNPRSYIFEWTQDWRKRYKNGTQLDTE